MSEEVRGERPRITLAASSEPFSGVGLHSGADASVRLHPASGGTGLVFRVQDSGQEIPARAANVTETSRCTRLAAGGYEIQTVEHILSALAGLGVDDAVIEIDGPEVPAADGSAAPFVRLIQAAGLQKLTQTVNPLTFSSPELVVAGASTLIVMPADRFYLTVVLDYPNKPVIQTQGASFDPAAEDYSREIAPARTFGFLSEWETLRSHGLALGASYENALVLNDNGGFVTDGHGNVYTPPRFRNELARHKILDLIGDLALVGQPIQAHVIAIKPSHSINTRLAQILS